MNTNTSMMIDSNELDYFGDGKRVNILDAATLAVLGHGVVSRHKLAFGDVKFNLKRATNGSKWLMLDAVLS